MPSLSHYLDRLIKDEYEARSLADLADDEDALSVYIAEREARLSALIERMRLDNPTQE